MICIVFFFQAEDGIRDLVRSRGLGDVYKRQVCRPASSRAYTKSSGDLGETIMALVCRRKAPPNCCLLYTSDAADERSSVDLGGRRIIKKKKREKRAEHSITSQPTIKRHN